MFTPCTGEARGLGRHHVWWWSLFAREPELGRKERKKREGNKTRRSFLFTLLKEKGVAAVEMISGEADIESTLASGNKLGKVIWHVGSSCKRKHDHQTTIPYANVIYIFGAMSSVSSVVWSDCLLYRLAMKEFYLHILEWSCMRP